jgi:hypothetical protein
VTLICPVAARIPGLHTIAAMQQLDLAPKSMLRCPTMRSYMLNLADGGTTDMFAQWGQAYAQFLLSDLAQQERAAWPLVVQQCYGYILRSYVMQQACCIVTRPHASPHCVDARNQADALDSTDGSQEFASLGAYQLWHRSLWVEMPMAAAPGPCCRRQRVIDNISAA